jgi:SAM-dependent methyltransferase
MNSFSIMFSKIKSLGLDATAFSKTPPDRRISLWRLQSPRIDNLYATRRLGKVVDLGCGPFENRGHVRQESGPHNYVGVDLDLSNKPDVVADIAHLPFADETLGVVRSASVFEHTYNYQEIVGDIYRALRPNGVLLIQTLWLLEFHGYPSDYFRFSHVAWQRILEDAGYRVLDCDIEWGHGLFLNLARIFEDVSFHFDWYWVRFALRLAGKIFWWMRWFDKHYRGTLYASVLILAEKPLAVSS